MIQQGPREDEWRGDGGARGVGVDAAADADLLGGSRE